MSDMKIEVRIRRECPHAQRDRFSGQECGCVDGYEYEWMSLEEAVRVAHEEAVKNSVPMFTPMSQTDVAKVREEAFKIAAQALAEQDPSAN